VAKDGDDPGRPVAILRDAASAAPQDEVGDKPSPALMAAIDFLRWIESGGCRHNGA
jgi:hypothetical protein